MRNHRILNTAHLHFLARLVLRPKMKQPQVTVPS